MLEIKPCGLGPRTRNVEAFWYKPEIKIIYFVPLCFIVFDFMVYLDPKFLILKTKNQPRFFSEVRNWFFLFYVITQGICNKFIEINISVGCMVWPWMRLLQDWTFVKYWWDKPEHVQPEKRQTWPKMFLARKS